MITLANFTLSLSLVVEQLERIANALEAMAQRDLPEAPAAPPRPARVTIRKTSNPRPEGHSEKLDSRAQTFSD